MRAAGAVRSLIRLLASARPALAALLALAALAPLLAACARAAPSPPPDAAAPTPSASAAAPPAVAPSAPTRADAAPRRDLAADLAARAVAAEAVLGPHTRTRTIGGVFLLAAPPSLGPLFDRAAALIERALPPLFDGRFTRRPDAAVTVLLFGTKARYDAYVASRYGAAGAGKYGLYRRESREIAADGSGGDAYLPTLTHEIVHPILDADFPGAPLWLQEAIASVYEAPVFPVGRGIRGEPRNWRHADLAAALASKAKGEEVDVAALFAMDDLTFVGWAPDGGVHPDANLLHCAMAREFATWLDSKGELWPFYRAWRDGFGADRTGERAFELATGTTPEAADAAWLAWLR